MKPKTYVATFGDGCRIILVGIFVFCGMATLVPALWMIQVGYITSNVLFTMTVFPLLGGFFFFAASVIHLLEKIAKATKETNELLAKTLKPEEAGQS